MKKTKTPRSAEKSNNTYSFPDRNTRLKAASSKEISTSDDLVDSLKSLKSHDAKKANELDKRRKKETKTLDKSMKQQPDCHSCSKKEIK